MHRDRIAQELADVPGIAFATLFGSQVEGGSRPDSDWDVAVYLDDRMSGAEREAVRNRLVAALAPQTPVDVVILNESPALLARCALGGERLLMRDERAWVRFFVRTLAEVGDEAYWRDLHAKERRRRLEEGRFGRP